MGSLDTLAVVFERPGQLRLDRVALSPPGPGDVVVEVNASGISTGTEKLLWNGRMPHFPGMGYPLVPGYESVGRIVEAGPLSGHSSGGAVFVPGARCYPQVRSLFGGAAQRLVVPGARAVGIDAALGEQATLLALAATAHHALHLAHVGLPDLIVGHGVLGRLIARLTLLLGGAGGATPTVWECDPRRMPAEGNSPAAVDYPVVHPEHDPRRDYRTIIDASGDAGQLDQLIARLAPGGQLILAGFYADPLQFSFAPAFMREASIRVAAEWKEADLLAVRSLAEAGRLSLDGLVTHRVPAGDALRAYETAFGDRGCLKMVMDWGACR